MATRASRIAGRQAINDRLKKLPSGVLCDCGHVGALAQHPERPQIRTVHRPSTCPKITFPRSAKEALELAPTATAWRAGPPRAPLAGVRSRSGVRCTSLTHTAQTISFFHRLATNNTEMEPIVAVHANILSPTGPGLATELPRYRRVATAPMPALVPNSARLCRFPGRDAGFGAQRGFCRPPII